MLNQEKVEKDLSGRESRSWDLLKINNNKGYFKN